MPDFSKAIRGESLRIPATTYNALMAMGERAQAPAVAGSAMPLAGYGHNLVHVQNTTNQTVPRFGVLGISGLSNTPTGQTFPEAIVFTGVAPNLTTHENRFVIPLEPIPAGRVGLAVAGGVFPCKLSLTNASHQFAGVKANDTRQLASGDCGVVQLLWVQNPNTTGPEKWAIGVL